MRGREDLAMGRFGVSLVSLVLAVSLWMAPVAAQDKLVMGYGGGT